MVIIEQLKVIGKYCWVSCVLQKYVKSCVIVKNTFKKLRWAKICEFRLTFRVDL